MTRVLKSTFLAAAPLPLSLRVDGSLAGVATPCHKCVEMSTPFSTVISVPCSCDTLELLARDECYPVVFDDMTGEYQLESVDGRWRYQIYHCPWCGGCLPSKRQTLFTEPDAAEETEVKELLSGAKSFADVLGVLGTPEGATDCGEMEIPKAYLSNVESGKRQQSAHTYTTRWTTLDLHIIEFDDGSISYAISGKFKGAPPFPKGKGSWWPWKRH